MKDFEFEEYMYLKENVKKRCENIIKLIKLHGDLIFKTKKGDKLKHDIVYNSNYIIRFLDKNLDDYFHASHQFVNRKNISKNYVYVHHLDKNPDDLPEDDESVVLIYKLKNCDFIYQEVATYNKEKNLFYIDEITYVDPDAKLLAWHKTIKYKEVCKK